MKVIKFVFLSLLLILSSGLYADERGSHLTASILLNNDTLKNFFKIPHYPIIYKSGEASGQNRNTIKQDLIDLDDALSSLERTLIWQEIKIRLGILFGYLDEKKLTYDERIYLKLMYGLGDISDIKKELDDISKLSKNNFNEFLKKLFVFRVEDKQATIKLHKGFNISSGNPIKLSNVNIDAELVFRPCIHVFGIKSCAKNTSIKGKLKNTSMNVLASIGRNKNTNKPEKIIFSFHPKKNKESIIEYKFKVGLIEFHEKEDVSKYFSQIPNYEASLSAFSDLIGGIKEDVPGVGVMKLELTDVILNNQNPMKIDFYTRIKRVIKKE